MPTTHGGKNVQFDWHLNGDFLVIKNEYNRIHKYHLEEIVNVIGWLKKEFGLHWFPLSNNVQKMGNGTERKGLGVAILNQAPDDIEHAQGSSYLGVVLDQVGILEWNGEKRGIQWRITGSINSEDVIRNALSEVSAKKTYYRKKIYDSSTDQ